MAKAIPGGILLVGCVRNDEHGRVVHWIDSDRDRVGVGGSPVAGRDRERVGAVEVEVAGIGEARQRRVDLRGRAGDAHAGGAVAGDAAAGDHIEDAVSDRPAWW